MKRCNGNEKVGAGLYMNVGELSFKALDKEGVLPGTEMDTYYRVPALAMLIAGPILGAAYVMFLPCIGFGILLWTLGEKAVVLAAEVVEAVARVIKPTWHPTMAFLSKNKAKAKTAADEGKDKWAEDVERKLDEEGDDEPRT